MSCLGFKGGIGTASRITPSGHVVGVLLLSNFGARERLSVDGVPVGRLLPVPGEAAAARPAPGGSCIVLVVTDAPVDSAGCVRLARRAGLGLARTGSIASHGSGEIFLAMATGLRAPRTYGRRPEESRADGQSAPLTGRALDPLFAAVVEATEESVLNSLLAAPTVVGRNGHTSYGLPVAPVKELLKAHGRGQR
jgi:D-aminopeptidase